MVFLTNTHTQTNREFFKKSENLEKHKQKQEGRI